MLVAHELRVEGEYFGDRGEFGDSNGFGRSRIGFGGSRE
jgi:hypothetical protein